MNQNRSGTPSLRQREEPRQGPGWAHAIFLLASAALAGWEADRLFAPTSSVRAAGRQPYVIVDAFAVGEPVGQTFRILDDGLEGVEVQLSSDRPASVDITWRLLGTARDTPNDGPSRWAPIHEARTTLVLPRGRSVHRFAFHPIFPSEKRVYQFQVQRLGVRSRDPARPGHAVVGVIASRDDALPEGNVVVDKQQIAEQDLLFQAWSADLFTWFRVRANSSLPRLLRNQNVQLVLLLAYNWALAVFAFEMIVWRPMVDGGSSPVSLGNRRGASAAVAAPPSDPASSAGVLSRDR